MRKLRRGELTRSILEILAVRSQRFIDINTILLSSGCASISPRGMDFQIRQLEKAREKMSLEQEQRQKLSSLIYKLKKEGLIQTGDRGWQITRLGLNKIKELKNKLLKRPNYKKEKDDLLKIFAFDVPERCKNDRDWIRLVLKELGFEMLQKSLWVGRIKLPQEFIEDLQRKGLIDYIKILAVSKAGNLKQYF